MKWVILNIWIYLTLSALIFPDRVRNLPDETPSRCTLMTTIGAYPSAEFFVDLFRFKYFCLGVIPTFFISSESEGILFN